MLERDSALDPEDKVISYTTYTLVHFHLTAPAWINSIATDRNTLQVVQKCCQTMQHFCITCSYISPWDSHQPPGLSLSSWRICSLERLWIALWMLLQPSTSNYFANAIPTDWQVDHHRYTTGMDETKEQIQSFKWIANLEVKSNVRADTPLKSNNEMASRQSNLTVSIVIPLVFVQSSVNSSQEYWYWGVQNS